MEILYVRVSTVSQNVDRQLEHISADKVFCDKISGKSAANRPELAAMMDYARENDTVHFHSFDRAARNLKDLLSIIDTLNGKGVTVKFHKENLTFSGNGEADPMSKLLCGLLGSVYEFERNLIVQRVREGVAIAHAAGKYKNVGRKPTLSKETIAELKERHKNGTRPTDLARLYGVSRATIYNYLAAND